jgi:hypothetical protein
LVRTFVERLVSIVTSISFWSLYVYNGKNHEQFVEKTQYIH